MSKAFTRESEGSDEDPVILPSQPQLPAGAKNYITEEGARQLREELERLSAERSALAAKSSEDAAKRRLPWIEARAGYLHRSLQSAVVVPEGHSPPDRVRFGVRVTVREGSGAEIDYRIVGVDETDLERNWISLYSPLARALMNKSVGDKVRFAAPGGEQVLEILRLK